MVANLSSRDDEGVGVGGSGCVDGVALESLCCCVIRDVDLVGVGGAGCLDGRKFGNLRCSLIEGYGDGGDCLDGVDRVGGLGGVEGLLWSGCAIGGVPLPVRACGSLVVLMS